MDMNDDSLKGTPLRVAKAYVKELFGGLNPKNLPKASTFDNKYQYGEMLVEKNITVFSTCEHHLLPIYGKAHVAYFSNGNVIGISEVNISNATVTLTLSSKILAGHTTTVSYTGTSITDSTVNNNPVATFNNAVVQNNVSVPVPDSAHITDANADIITLVFPETIKGSAANSVFDVS